MIEHQTPCWILPNTRSKQPKPPGYEIPMWRCSGILVKRPWQNRCCWLKLETQPTSYRSLNEEVSSGFCFTFSRPLDFFIGFTFWFSCVLEPFFWMCCPLKDCVAPCDAHFSFWRCCFGFWVQTKPSPQILGPNLPPPKIDSKGCGIFHCHSESFSGFFSDL